MPRVAALRLMGLLIAGLVWSVGCWVTGGSFCLPGHGSTVHEDIPPIVVSVVLLLTLGALWKRSLVLVCVVFVQQKLSERRFSVVVKVSSARCRPELLFTRAG